MKHPLADEHRTGRLGLLELGRSLNDDDAAIVTTACPDWTIKDVYAHLAGISTDILAGNTENAATEAWADGHVADRRDRSLTEVLDEWQGAAATVDELIAEAGEMFPFQLFIDQWTHEWDIRAALGERAAAVPDLGVCDHVFEPLVENQQGRAPQGIGTLEVAVGARTSVLGDGEPLGCLTLSPFEFTRIAMGRRSRAQLDALPWPSGVTDTTPWIDTLVAWSVNDRDVIDPVRDE